MTGTSIEVTNIKHNRIPAPTMSFTRPDLPALIDEIEEAGKA